MTRDDNTTIIRPGENGAAFGSSRREISFAKVQDR